MGMYLADDGRELVDGNGVLMLNCCREATTDGSSDEIELICILQTILFPRFK